MSLETELVNFLQDPERKARLMQAAEDALSDRQQVLSDFRRDLILDKLKGVIITAARQAADEIVERATKRLRRSQSHRSDVQIEGREMTDLMDQTLAWIERELGPDAAKAAYLNGDDLTLAAALERAHPVYGLTLLAREIFDQREDAPVPCDDECRCEQCWPTDWIGDR